MKKLKAVICALFRHSRIVTNCFGYLSCGRCGAQLGDTIAGTGLPAGVGGYFLANGTCRCEECRAAFDSLGLLDRFMVQRVKFPDDATVKRAAEEQAEIRRKMREAVEATRSHRESLAQGVGLDAAAGETKNTEDL